MQSGNGEETPGTGMRSCCMPDSEEQEKPYRLTTVTTVGRHPARLSQQLMEADTEELYRHTTFPSARQDKEARPHTRGRASNLSVLKYLTA